MKFEDALPTINSLIEQQKNRWRLERADIDYEDVSQEIRLHVIAKWSLYDEKKPLVNWASRVIHRKICNMLKHFHQRIAPPSAFECKCTETRKCRKCKDWEKKKRTAYCITYPETTDGPGFSYSNIERITYEYGDEEEKINLLNNRILETLANDKLRNVYRWLFMEGKDEEYVAKQLNLTTTEEGRKPGYRQIQNYKKLLFNHAKKIVEKEDLYE